MRNDKLHTELGQICPLNYLVCSENGNALIVARIRHGRLENINNVFVGKPDTAILFRNYNKYGLRAGFRSPKRLKTLFRLNGPPDKLCFCLFRFVLA